MFVAQKRLMRKGEITFTLMSDLHLGAPNVDTDRIRADLTEARENEDRILLDGDIFDAILPTDKKRFRMEALAKTLQGRSDILNRLVEMAFKELSPYADLIDLIAIGNHEESVEKYHSFDPVQALVYRLNQIPGADVRYGGISGFFDYRITEPRDTKAARERKNHGGNRWRYLIFYHHGSGGSSPVTKGIIQFNRMETWVEADLLWVGHGHNRILDATTVRVSVSNNGNIVFRPCRAVMTGGYLWNHEPDTSEAYMAGGTKRVSYAESKNLPPQESGGARVIVELLDRAKLGKVRIVM
jgi:hypothetical protein